MKEIWLKIPGASRYEASNQGQIRIIKTGKILNQFKCLDAYPGGYLCVRIHFDNDTIVNRTVHRLIAITFIPNPENKKTVNHKFGIKTDNRVSELEWATSGENNQHAYDTGLKKYRPLHYKGKFGKDHNRSIAVICNETGIEYGSMSEAERELGWGQGGVKWSMKFNRPIFGKTFRLVD